ncbi:MAG: putative solute:sodium symporter small subunit [Candidatus Promineifilaceae bacterium]|jgi:putative solute:sodium symporter small subunit
MSDSKEQSIRDLYWKTNIRYLVVLLSIWFVVSYGCGILFVDQLDKIRIPGTGFKLGFWFAQQGSIYVFVGLIFVYVRLMNNLDHKHGLSEDVEPDEGKDFQI